MSYRSALNWCFRFFCEPTSSYTWIETGDWIRESWMKQMHLISFAKEAVNRVPYVVYRERPPACVLCTISGDPCHPWHQSVCAYTTTPYNPPLGNFLGHIVSFCLGALTRLLTTIPQVLNHNWGGSWHPFVYPALGIFFYSYKYWRKYFSEKIVALDVFRFKLLI